MQSFPSTIVLRHRRENLKKCSLRGLESRPDFKFFKYPYPVLPNINGYILLALDAPLLSKEDRDKGLFIVDATWRYAQTMIDNVPGLEVLERRSLPNHYKTAYPRRQDDCPDPERGLASVEAIYIAYHIMGHDPSGLLDNYHWKDKFLEINGLPKKT